jgi:hypothetical protein
MDEMDIIYILLSKFKQLSPMEDITLFNFFFL